MIIIIKKATFSLNTARLCYKANIILTNETFLKYGRNIVKNGQTVLKKQHFP